MIAGIFHQGSGLGNQLHRYVMVRVLAEDKGYEWDMFYQPDGSGKEVGFKGKSFMNIEWPHKELFVPQYNFSEKKVVENGVDIRGYDPEVNFIPDGTMIEGEFQDERYFEHRLEDIDKWLAVEPMKMDKNLCVIGFRGGEYSLYPDLFLTDKYWMQGIQKMRQINKHMHFEVHTDDAELARLYFPTFPIIQDVAVNWRSMRYAKYAIIANSSFYIFPRLLRKGITVAPRYWARHNTQTWALPQNYYKSFIYI